MCNLKCRYCYVEKERGNGKFDKDLLDNLIRFIRETNDEEELTISFFGGEPLLEISLIKEIIKRIEKEHFFHAKYYMTTNGVLLNQEIIDFIKEKQIILSLSWDGNQKANDINRVDLYNNGTYEKIKESYLELRKNQIDVRVRATFNSQTMDFLKDSVEDLYRIDNEMDVIFVPDYFDTEWTEDKLKRLEEDIRLIKKKNRENIMIIGDKELRKCRCSGGKDSYHIYIDGAVYPCSFVVNNKDFLIGNIADGIDKRIVSELCQKYMENLEGCNGCDYEKYCLSNKCRYLNWKLTGNMSKAAGVVCGFENIKMSVT